MAVYYKTGNLSHKKGQGIHKKRGRPKGSRKKRHFTALAAGRVVAYARRDGADDALLAKYLIYSFGVGNIPCLISQAVNIAANAILLGVVFKFLRGLSFIYRGLMLIRESAAVEYVGLLFSDLYALLQAEYGWAFIALTKGEWLVWVGSIQSGLAALIIFLDSFADQIVYFRFGDKVCSTKIEEHPYRITPKPLL